MRNVLLTLAAASIALVACGDGGTLGQQPDGGGDGGSDVRRPTEWAFSPSRKLDILFLIDNSLSMQPMQEALAMNLGNFMMPLRNLPGGLPNLHIGVIS